METSSLPPLPPAAPEPHSSNGGKLRALFSPAALKKEIRQVAVRFPVTLVFVALLSVYAITFVWDVKWPDDLAVSVGISLSLGALMSLAAYVWNEFLCFGRRQTLWLGATVAFVTVNFFYLYNRAAHLSFVDGIGYAAAYTALVVALLFLPAVRRSTVRLQWLYSVAILEAIAMALLLSFVLGTFCSLVFGTLNLLFGLSDFKIVGTLGILLAGTLPVVAGLCYIPRFDALADVAADEKAVAGHGISVFTKNVLLPLAVVYILILYLYGLKILITFNLPDGYVSWMVIGLVSVTLLIVYGLQGFVCSTSAKAETRRLAQLALRCLPALLFPLLVLMSVAIFYRINQYGVTPSRLYVATFNVWAYFVVAYLFFAARPRLNLVASSFALIFLLTSVIPHFNYCSWGLRAVHDKVETELRRAGAEDFPLSYGQLTDLINTLPRDRAESIATDLSWLDEWDNHSAVSDLVASDETLYRWKLLDGYSGEDTRIIRVNKKVEPEVSPVPHAYSSVQYHTKWYYDDFAPDSSGRYKMELIPDVWLDLPVDSLSQLGAEDEFRPVRVSVLDSPDAVFYMTECTLNGDRTKSKPYSNITVSGYLFRK